MSDPAALATTEAPDTVEIITGGRRTTILWSERHEKTPEHVQESVRKAYDKERGGPEKPVETPPAKHVRGAVRAAFALATKVPEPKLPVEPVGVIVEEPTPAPVEPPKRVVKANPAKRPVTVVRFPEAPPAPAIVERLPEPIAQPVAEGAIEALFALLDEHERMSREEEENVVRHFIESVLDGELVS